MRRTRGFTLIELMIVVAIIAVLAVIAVPTYNRYVYRSHRTDGQKLLMHIAQAEERYYTDYNRYPLSAASLGYTGANNPPTSENGYYTAVLGPLAGSSAGQGYVATATPQGAQANDVCQALSIDSTGQKLPSAASTARNSNGNCW